MFEMFPKWILILESSIFTKNNERCFKNVSMLKNVLKISRIFDKFSIHNVSKISVNILISLLGVEGGRCEIRICGRRTDDHEQMMMLMGCARTWCALLPLPRIHIPSSEIRSVLPS